MTNILSYRHEFIVHPDVPWFEVGDSVIAHGCKRIIVKIEQSQDGYRYLLTYGYAAMEEEIRLA
jgi:hypothetical protein